MGGYVNIVTALIGAAAIIAAALIAARVIIRVRVEPDAADPPRSSGIPPPSSPTNPPQMPERHSSDTAAAPLLSQQLGVDYRALVSSTISDAKFLSEQYIVDLLTQLKYHEKVGDK